MKHVPTNTIRENEKNPRKVDKAKFKKLVNSLREFPDMLEKRPLIIADGVILGGNMRYKAALELGLKTVPVIDASDWTEDQRQQFIIKDNLNFGEWDWDILANEWDALELEAWGLDVWTPEEEPTEGLTDPDDVPEVPEEPKTKLGDLYILGEHRLLCGDSTKAEDVERLMDGNKADMVFTDPPYGIKYKPKGNHSSIKNDNTFLEDWIPFIDLHSTGFVFIWTGYQVVHEWLRITEPLGQITNMIIWSKGGGGLGDLYKRFATDFEIALVWNRGADLKGKRIGSVWEVNKDSSAKYVHPTQKPVELIEKALLNTTAHKDIVMDLFVGSGSTLIGAEKTGRKCYGMELDPKYCDVIVKRWEEFTGKKAEKI